MNWVLITIVKVLGGYIDGGDSGEHREKRIAWSIAAYLDSLFKLTPFSNDTHFSIS